MTTSWNPSYSYPYADSPQPWGHLAAPRHTYDQSYANPATGLQNLSAFAQDASIQGHPRHPESSNHGVDPTASLGWNSQTVQVHPFDYGASTTLPTSLPVSHDQLYTQAPPNQSYQNFQPKYISGSLPSEPYASAQPDSRQSMLPNTTQAQNFVPTPVSRQQSFASDDWQKLSPPSASAPNGKHFTFDDKAETERDLAMKPIKQEFKFPGKQTTSSRKCAVVT